MTVMEEILRKHLHVNAKVDGVNQYFSYKLAMQEYAQLKVKEALELAADSAEIKTIPNGIIGFNQTSYRNVIDKQSITNTFEQIKFD